MHDSLQIALSLLPNPVFSGTLDDITACPSSGGIYWVQITLYRPIELLRPTPTLLPSGMYLYLGSAHGPGGLRARLKRHLKDEKRIRWHIDQLTTQTVEKQAIGWTDGTECDLREALETTGCFSHPMGRFGSSDCRLCPSHLMRVID